MWYYRYLPTINDSLLPGYKKCFMNNKIVQLFDEKECVNFCAPMVRYSKYNVDVAFTPMMVADSFYRSEKARNADFSTDIIDTPIIAQFASNDGPTLVKAVSHIYNFVDGVDINCGCPQRRILSLDYGAALLKKPEIICDLIQHLSRNFSSLCRSVKIRLLADLRETIELTKRAEICGANFITIHSRTTQKNAPIDYEAFLHVKENLNIPVVLNGDVFDFNKIGDVLEKTKANGVMCARSLLNNPCFFSGFESTTPECIEEYIKLAHTFPTKLSVMRNHLIFMTHEKMNKSDRSHLSLLKADRDIIEFITKKFDIKYDELKVTDTNKDIDIEELLRKNLNFTDS